MKKTIILFGIISVLATAREKEITLEKSTVVSTTGFTDSLVKENKNVIIISKDDIEKKEYKNVEEVLRDTPNVNIQDTYFGPVVDLRGNGSRALSRVKVLVNGIAINPIDESMGTLPINAVAVSDIDKIEVIPGSGAVINGSGTAGGIVNIITKSMVRKNYMIADYGNSSYSTNRVGVSAGYNVNDDFYVHGGYSYQKGNGYRVGDDRENGSANAGFEYKLTSNQKVRFNVSKFKGDEDNSTPIKKDILDKDRKKSGFPVESKIERDSYSLDYEVKPTKDLTLLTTVYQHHLKRDFVEDSILDEYVMDMSSMKSKNSPSKPTTGSSGHPGAGTHTTGAITGGHGGSSHGGAVAGGHGSSSHGGAVVGGHGSSSHSGAVVGGHGGASRPSKLVAYNLPNTMTGNFDEKTRGAKIRGKYEYDNGDIVFGYDYSKTKLKRGSVINTRGNFSGIPTNIKIAILNDVYKETNGIYGINRYNLTKELSLITGLRYEHSKFGGDRDSNTFVSYTLPKYIPKMGGKTMEHNIPKSMSDKKTSDDFAGELGINYLYSETGNVFARYERGFISPMPGQITDKTKDGMYKSNNLKSETSDNFEIGVRDYLGNTYVSWNIFTTFTNDEITLIQGGNHNPATKYWSYKNIDKTRRIGTEVVAEHDFDKFNLSEGLTYVNTKITKGEYKGEKVPLAPEMKLTLKANYKVTEKLTTGVTFNYLGKTTVREFDKNDKAYTTNIKGYHTTDLGVQYQFNENFAVNAGINNVFDKKYNLSETKTYAIPAAERTYYVGAKLKF